MRPTVGFILLTHNQPNQIVRLVTALNRMFNYPLIVCHHDFSKTHFPTDMLTQNVVLVRPHLQTGWSKFSVVEAMMRAIQLMYENSTSPDWFVLLSGADYPIKSAQRILSDLAVSQFDVHIHHEKINYNAYERAWQELCFSRYCGVKLGFPFLTLRHITLTHPFLTAPFVPFSKDFHCFAGEVWFCANRKAAKYLINYHREKPALAAHYRRLDPYTITPEESYQHTIFCNAPDLKVSGNHWRYIDWSTQGSHPKTLMIADLPKIQASSAHFARKFNADQDARILNELDFNIVGIANKMS